MLRIAAPTVASMASVPAMTFVDRYFCGQLGAEGLAASGNGGLIAWVPVSAMMGIIGVVGTFVSQNLGAGRPERGAAYAWNALWLVLLVWVLIYLPLAYYVPDIMAAVRGLFGVHDMDPVIARNEALFARIQLCGMCVVLGGRAFHQWFFGMHRTLVPMVGVLSGNVLNFFLTWFFVLGGFGWKGWGVPGSAAANLFGAAVELVVPLVVFLGAANRAKYATLSSWRPDLSKIGEIVKLGWPAGLMFGNEMVCWGIFMAVLVAQFGAAHNAAAYIALAYMQTSFMPAVGMSYAVQSIVGKSIGAGRPDEAASRAWQGVRVTMVYMVLCALCFVLFRHQLVGVLMPAQGEQGGGDPAEIMALGSSLLILAASFQIFDAMGITMIGALRGAGDTVWPGVMTMALSWTVIVGGGRLMVKMMPEWKSYGPWVAASAYIILFAIGVVWRWQSGVWRRIKVLQDGPADAGEVVRADAAPMPTGGEIAGVPGEMAPPEPV